MQKRVKDLHRKFPVGSFVTDQRKTFKVTEHREPEKSWTEDYAIWPFAGVRWIKSRKSWSKRELLISDKLKAVPDPQKKEASMAARVASRFMEYKGEASTDDFNALVINIAGLAGDELEKAGWKRPSDMADQTIPYIKDITTAEWGGGPKVSRVASRYLIALRIDQRRGEYPTKFWRDVTLRLCKTLGVNPTKLKVLFRKGVAKLKDSPGGICRHGYHIELDPDRPLPQQFGTLAHELRHAYQMQTKMLTCERRNDAGELGRFWEGTFYPEDTPYNDRPWEIDARKHEVVGRRLHEQMERQGEIPLSKQQAFRQSEPFQGPTLGDMDDVLSEDEFVAEVKERKKDKAAWLEKWRERYRTGWRGLKVSPEIGDLDRLEW